MALISGLNAHSSAAMRCGIELSADEILGEPDDQVVIDRHLHPLAKRPLTLACAPAVGDIAAASVQPLRRAIFVEQEIQQHLRTTFGNRVLSNLDLKLSVRSHKITE